MPRVSKAVKAQYQPLVRSGQTEEQCYFCGKAASMDDLTPNPSAMSTDLASFTDPWTMVKACGTCWRTIYTANIVQSGKRFNAPHGCMTLRQKEALLGHNQAAVSAESLQYKIGFGFEPRMLAPVGMTQLSDDGRYVWQGKTFYLDEMITLQGALALKMVGGNDDHIWALVVTGLASGELNGEKIPLYLEMLELSPEGRISDPTH